MKPGIIFTVYDAIEHTALNIRLTRRICGMDVPIIVATNNPKFSETLEPDIIVARTEENRGYQQGELDNITCGLKKAAELGLDCQLPRARGSGIVAGHGTRAARGHPPRSAQCHGAHARSFHYRSGR